MGKQNKKGTAEVIDQIIETGSVEEIKEEKDVVTGVVKNCSSLNLRNRPNLDSDIITELPVSTKVTILHEANATFYRIATPAGVEGYCMKKYITIE